MSKERLELIESEILKTENTLTRLEYELHERDPKYKRILNTAEELISRAKRIKRAIKRDKSFFKA